MVVRKILDDMQATVVQAPRLQSFTGILNRTSALQANVHAACGHFWRSRELRCGPLRAQQRSLFEHGPRTSAPARHCAATAP